MAVQTLTLAGRKYVLLPESEYRRLSRGPVARRRPRSGSDAAEAARRLNDPRETRTPWEQVKRQAGLK